MILSITEASYEMSDLSEQNRNALSAVLLTSHKRLTDDLAYSQFQTEYWAKKSVETAALLAENDALIEKLMVPVDDGGETLTTPPTETPTP